jgi:type IV secretory pathway VirB9-like protein
VKGVYEERFNKFNVTSRTKLRDPPVTFTYPSEEAVNRAAALQQLAFKEREDRERAGKELVATLHEAGMHYRCGPDCPNHVPLPDEE